jgi:hypothetical protein
LRACSMCRAPYFVWLFLTLPAVAENGGFMAITVGFTFSGRMLSSCSAFSVKIFVNGKFCRISARLGESSLA